MMIKPSKQTGFTIIELIMVVCMIALVMAFAGPSLDGYTQEIKTKAVAREIYTNLQLARLTAIKENRDINVTLTLNGVASMSLKRDDNTNVIPDINFNDDFPRVILSSTRNGFITFKPSGTIDANQNQTITASYNNPNITTEYDVVINVSGGIRFAKS